MPDKQIEKAITTIMDSASSTEELNSLLNMAAQELESKCEFHIHLTASYD